MSAASNPPPVPFAQLSPRLLTSPPAQRLRVGLVIGFLRLPAFAARGLAQVLIKIGMMRFQMFDDLEVLFFHPAQVDPLHVNQPQQLANGFGHAAAALVARAAALRYPDPGPEFLLIQSQAPADFPRVDEIEQFHAFPLPAAAELWPWLCQQHGACQVANCPLEPGGACWGRPGWSLPAVLFCDKIQ